MKYNTALRIWLGACAILAFGACNVNRPLQEGQSYVARNTIVFQGTENVPDKRTLKYELSSVLKQKPNSRVFGLFPARLWFYYRHSEPADSSRWDRWVMNNVAERPVLYQPELAEASATAMRNLLQNRGYFKAQVAYERAERRPKRSHITYTVAPGPQYTYDSLRFFSSDPLVDSLLQATRGASFLKKGEVVDGRYYEREVNRIVRLMRNHGMAGFTRNFVAPLEADTAGYKAQARLQVFTPPDAQVHPRYHIGKVAVLPDFDPRSAARYQPVDTVDGVEIWAYGESRVRHEILVDYVALRPGTPYRQEAIDQTTRQLNGMGIYKFASLQLSQPDSLLPILDLSILLPPRKRMSISGDVELNTANNAVFNNTSIGTALSLNFLNRNAFRGAEVFSLNAQGGVEFAINDPRRDINTVNATAEAALFVPRYIGIRVPFTRHIRNESKTRIRLGYDYVQLVDFYSYNSFNAEFGYEIPVSANSKIFYNPLGLNYFDPTAQSAFQNILDNNPFLARSFGQQLFTSVFFRNASFVYQPLPNTAQESYYASISLEQSGGEVLLANLLYRPDEPFRLFDDGSYSQHLRLEAEGRYTKQYTPQHALATRLSLGLALPYGPFSSSVPYVKQFFMGGPNSLRAWRIRELGPGSYVDEFSLDPDNTLPFYQTGDVKIEMNAEYRFPFFSPIKLALFADAGNIWTLRADPERPGSGIGLGFWEQIAIGSGLGLRFDFSFFVLRLDMGVRLRNPYRDSAGSFWPRAYYDSFTLGSINYNLAIGYPF